MNPPPSQFTQSSIPGSQSSPRATVNTRAGRLRQTACAILILIGLAWLTGCQGFGAGGTGIAKTPGTLASNLASLAFGNVTVGKTQSLPAKMTNSGSSSITISQVGISGTGFALGGMRAPLTLAAGQSMDFSVTFSPSNSGTANGNVTINSDASNSTLTIPVSGTGTAVAAGFLTTSSTDLNFGSVTVGSNQSLSTIITNTGDATVTISQVGLSGAGFIVNGIATPLTLAAGQSTSLDAKFAPVTTGTASWERHHHVGCVESHAHRHPVRYGNRRPSRDFEFQPDQSELRKCDSGKQSVPFHDNHQHWQRQRHDLSGLHQRHRLYVERITTPLTLAAGQSTSLAAKFAPTTTGSASGNVTITSNASNPTLTVSISGTGTAVPVGTLSSNPTSLGFGNVTVGSNQSLSTTITNTGSASVTISQASISGTGFTLSGITTPLTLTAGQSTSLAVKFAPTTTGSASGNVTITSNASNPSLTVSLSGTGTAVPVGTLGSNPTSLGFGNVTVGSNQSLSTTITNTGSASVTISQASISGTGFTLSGITTPLTLTAGQSTSLAVKFAPTTTGSASGNVTITSNASNPTLTVPVSGTGIAAGQLSAAPNSLNFGNVTVGQNQSLSSTVTNIGGSSVTISQVATSGAGFTFDGNRYADDTGGGAERSHQRQVRTYNLGKRQRVTSQLLRTPLTRR